VAVLADKNIFCAPKCTCGCLKRAVTSEVGAQNTFLIRFSAFFGILRTIKASRGLLEAKKSVKTA
jgi:hypothetical protein